MLIYLRSAGALLTGFVAMAVLVMLTTAAAVKLLLSQPDCPTPLYLAVNLTCGLLSAMAGGWVTARLAPRAPLLHALVLAVVAVALLLAQPPAGGQPSWYGYAMAGIVAAGLLLGALFRSR